MHTLFSADILSRSPDAGTSKPVDPFELRFHSAAAAATAGASSYTSSNASSQGSSCARDCWLTDRMQDDADAIAKKAARQDELMKMGLKGDPRLLIMGMRRCGKSSVQRVVFSKLAPADALYNVPTTVVEKASMSSFINVESFEIPTNLSPTTPGFDSTPLFSHTGAVVWVLDSQDEYLPAVGELLHVAVFLAENHPSIRLSILLHKAENLTDPYLADMQREVRQRLNDELSDNGLPEMRVDFYYTSIFNHSVFEAMSQIVSKMLPQLPAMEAMLTRLCATCRVQKAYLFDTVSKLYIADDASPPSPKDYELCSDYVDAVVDIKTLYGWHQRPGETGGVGAEEISESVVTYAPTGDTYIYTREVSENLSLICVLGEGSSADKRVLIDYNIEVLHEALGKLFRV